MIRQALLLCLGLAVLAAPAGGGVRADGPWPKAPPGGPIEPGVSRHVSPGDPHSAGGDADVVPSPAPAAAAMDGPYVPGELLVKFSRQPKGADIRGQAAASAAASALARHGAARIKHFPHVGVSLVRVAVGQEEQAARELTLDPAVQYAEPNYIVWPADIPDDPRFGDLRHWCMAYSAPARGRGAVDRPEGATGRVRTPTRPLPP